MRQFIYGDLRVQVLSDDIIRLEMCKNGAFCDDKTFFIPDRSIYADTLPQATADGNTVTAGDYTVCIPKSGAPKGITVVKNGKTVFKYKQAINSGELPELDKTPEVYAVYDNPRIIVPEGGYSAHRKGEYKVEENVVDVYLLLCGKDYKKLRKLYVELTGRSELVRLSTLGAWNSKYFVYDEQSAKQQILDFEAHDVPLDNLVIDTDWRSCENGWGYDVNTALFPDMKRVLDFAHEHGVEVMFNDHPEPVDGASVFEPREIEYRERNLQALMDIGLDTWWYDRNWSTHLISPTDNVFWETFGLYLFADITANYYRKAWGDDKVYRRPVVMGNVVNVRNGEYDGIKDSASHRYSVQWTGDIMSDKAALGQEVRTLIKAGESCITYVNADCGGHVGNPDAETFVRWMQFGAFSPVFRPHCTNSVKRTREPWAYGDETVLSIVREYYNMRYRLMPVLYTAAYESYAYGAPMFRSLAWNYPSDKRARRNDEYMLSGDLIISPVAGKAPDGPLDAKYYASPVKATFFDGRELKGAPIAHAEWKTLGMRLDHVPPVKGVPIYDFSARFETKVKFDCAMKLIMCCDDGSTVYIDGKKVLEDDTLHGAQYFDLGVYEPNIEHDVVVEYFQAGGEACCILYADKYDDVGPKKVYLPQGEWLNVWDGTTHKGKAEIVGEYALRELPLFVRRGGVLALAENAKNTREQDHGVLAYDCYPSARAAGEGYIYEDDGESTAYKLGEYRKSAYKFFFDGESKAYTIELARAEGDFKGARAVKKRAVTVKLHLTDGLKISGATLNGAPVECEYIAKDESAYPFTFGASPDADCVAVKFTADVEKDYAVKFFI